MENEEMKAPAVPETSGSAQAPKASGVNQWSVPVAIIAAGVIVALAIVYGGTGKQQQAPKVNAPAAGQPAAGAPAQKEIAVKPISDADHVFGNAETAGVVVIEYSDLECPFCKRFHATMQQVVEAYDGKVAWAYRHFPLDQLHSKARKEAEATECAAELGGNDKFWAYTNRLIEVTPSNNGLDLAELPKIAAYVGLDKTKFTACLESGKYAAAIQASVEDAMAAGAQGTPYSVVVTQSGKKSVIPGALPFEQVKGIIDAALATQ